MPVSLERTIKERFQVSPHETCYFSPSGKISLEPSDDCFIKVNHSRDTKFIYFDFQRPVEWEKIEHLFADTKNGCAVIFGCDAERFRDLATEYHLLGSPIDEKIESYEVDLRTDEESLEVHSDDTFSKRFFIDYTNYKEFEMLSYDYCPELGDEKPIPEHIKTILDWRREFFYTVPGKEGLKALLSLSKEERNDLYYVYTKGGNEAVLFDVNELEERIQQQIDFFLKVPEMVRKGELKTEFKYKKDCEIEYFITRAYDGLTEIYSDSKVDSERDMFEVTKGYTNSTGDDLAFQMKYYSGACDVRGFLKIDLLGEGKLEELVRYFRD